MRYQPVLLLAGRSKLPEQERPETASIDSIEELRAFFVARGVRRQVAPCSADIEASCQALLHARRMRQALLALSRTGAVVRYFSVDVRDEAAFGALIDDLYADYGRIDGVIHGAGVAEDRLIEDKDPTSFDRVFDTKVLGALVLARKLRPELLKFLAFFSSMSGSFGNRGQVDYAAANAFLDRLAVHLDGKWPSRVVITWPWGPWELESGMMTDEVVRQFRQRGVPLVTPSAGREAADAELRRGRKGEVEVILGPFRGEW